MTISVLSVPLLLSVEVYLLFGYKTERGNGHLPTDQSSPMRQGLQFEDMILALDIDCVEALDHQNPLNKHKEEVVPLLEDQFQGFRIQIHHQVQDCPPRGRDSQLE
jgi:hypothetical protein